MAAVDVAANVVSATVVNAVNRRHLIIHNVYCSVSKSGVEFHICFVGNYIAFLAVKKN